MVENERTVLHVFTTTVSRVVIISETGQIITRPNYTHTHRHADKKSKVYTNVNLPLMPAAVITSECVRDGPSWKTSPSQNHNEVKI